MTTTTLYFVLREGSTREEQWTWEEIESLSRSGELTPGARIFLPEENRWAELGETRLAPVAQEVTPQRVDAEAEAAEVQKLEAEYTAAQERVETDADDLEARLDAGVIAAQLGRREQAKTHFQSVLSRYPYHARAAQEVKRRFSKQELRTFRYLDRPAPIWEDLSDVATMPLGRGPLYIAVPAVLIALFSFLPLGGVLIAALVFLWMFQAMEYTARGANKPPEWNRSFADPKRKLGRPALLMSIVALQLGVVILGLARVAMAIEGVKGQSTWGYMTASPIFMVIASIVCALYLPAAFVSIGGFMGPVSKTLDPRRLVKTMVRMEHEYVYTVVIIAAIGIVTAIACAIVSGVPVLRNLVLGAVLAYVTPAAGLVLGRLLGRAGHVIS